VERRNALENPSLSSPKFKNVSLLNLSKSSMGQQDIPHYIVCVNHFLLFSIESRVLTLCEKVLPCFIIWVVTK
jgi:hypothetical protein